jgi:hypothetical protein
MANLKGKKLGKKCMELCTKGRDVTANVNLQLFMGRLEYLPYF